jgi:hypothetical protein
MKTIGCAGLFKRCARTGGVLLIAVALPAVSGGCLEDDADDCVCSLEFRIIQVRVVDESGKPVPGVDVVATLVRTGEVLPKKFDIELPEGSYVVVTDGDTGKIRPGLGDEVRVAGSVDDRYFGTGYWITVDDCRCHVSKAAGPDQVVIR